MHFRISNKNLALLKWCHYRFVLPGSKCHLRHLNKWFATLFVFAYWHEELHSIVFSAVVYTCNYATDCLEGNHTTFYYGKNPNGARWKANVSFLLAEWDAGSICSPWFNNGMSTMKSTFPFFIPLNPVEQPMTQRWTVIKQKPECHLKSRSIIPQNWVYWSR